MNRFYCEHIEQGFLSEDESRHAAQVLRLDKGSRCSVFDGKGKEAHVRVVSLDGGQLRYEIVSKTQSDEPTFTLSLAQAIPKGKSMDLIVQKATELGVRNIWPLLSERTVVKVDADRKENKQHKWQHAALEACKQCGQNWMPTVHPTNSLTEFLQGLDRTALKLIGSLQPDAKPISEVIQDNRSQGQFKGHVVFLIGPEGDFTPAEIGQARGAGFQPVSLGPNILRSETAAIFVTSVLTYELQRGAE